MTKHQRYKTNDSPQTTDQIEETTTEILLKSISSKGVYIFQSNLIEPNILRNVKLKKNLT